MTVHLGFYNTATSRTHVRFQFSTHNAAGANVAPSTAIDAADIRIYKAADSAAFSATQRSSSAGVTVTSPFDTLTGFHDVDIDLTDNTDASFYVSGFYSVVLAPNDETIDSQVITGAVLAYFEIGVNPVNVTQWLGTAAATPTVAGVPEVDATHWNGTAVTTPPSVNATQISGDSTAADTLESWLDGTAGAYPELGIFDQGTAQSATATTLVLRAATPFGSDDACLGCTLMAFGSTQGYWQARLITDYTTADDTATVETWDVTPSGTITYKVFGTAPSSSSSPPTAAAIADAVWDEATAGHTTSGTFGEQLKTDVDAILADTNELQTDWANGGRLDLLIDATLADTNELQTDWANGGRLDLLLDSTLADTNELQTDWANGGRLDLLIDGVKAKTDSLTFTQAGHVDANVQRINDVAITGDGSAGDKFDVT